MWFVHCRQWSLIITEIKRSRQCNVRTNVLIRETIGPRTVYRQSQWHTGSGIRKVTMKKECWILILILRDTLLLCDYSGTDIQTFLIAVQLIQLLNYKVHIDIRYVIMLLWDFWALQLMSYQLELETIFDSMINFICFDCEFYLLFYKHLLFISIYVNFIVTLSFVLMTLIVT